MFHLVNSSISSSRLSATAEPIIDPPILPAKTTAIAQNGAPGPHIVDAPNLAN